MLATRAGKPGRSLRALCSALGLVVVLASCSQSGDTEDYVPSLAGALQPDGGGALIDEATACSQLVDAETAERKQLGCPAATHAACPAYIRPAGGADCFSYDQSSLDGCVKAYQGFQSCVDFDRHPCLLVAVANCPDSGVGEAGAAGASN
ncbi:MAG TPA: hypothetical protein VGM29_13485 [Polyangiaceae bacterium]|jgi:hypothetical protein